MYYILDHLAIGDYESVLECPPEIFAFLNVAHEKDIARTPYLCHKVPIMDMQPIPWEQMLEAVTWIADHINDRKILVFCNAGRRILDRMVWNHVISTLKNPELMQELILRRGLL